MKLRGALLGGGNIALRGHAPQWTGPLADDVEIVALADLSPANRTAAEQVFPGARLYGKAEDLLASEPLDFCDICTPPFTHRPLVEAAAGRGIHVLCEKPIAANLEDAEAIAHAVRSSGIVFVPCHQYHHSPQWQAVRAAAPAHRTRPPGRIRGAAHRGQPGQPQLDPRLAHRSRARGRRHPVRPRRPHLLPAPLGPRGAGHGARDRAHAAPLRLRRRGLGFRDARLRRPPRGGAPHLGGAAAGDPLPVRGSRRRARGRRRAADRARGDDRGGLLRRGDEPQLLPLGVVRAADERLRRAGARRRSLDRAARRGALRGPPDRARLRVVPGRARPALSTTGVPVARGAARAIGGDRSGLARRRGAVVRTGRATPGPDRKARAGVDPGGGARHAGRRPRLG